VFAHDTFSARFRQRLIEEHRNRRIYLRWLPVILVSLFLIALLFDAPISNTLRNWPAHERAFFAFVTGFGKSDWILFPTLVAMIASAAVLRAPLTYSWHWAARALGGISAYIFVSVGLAGLVTVVLKRLIGRGRPMYLEENGTLYFEPFDIIDWTLHSFPSGHSTTALAFTVVLLTLTNGRLGKTIIAFGLAIGLSRIVVGDHYLSDVIAGCLLGLLVALFVRDFFATKGWGMRIENGAIHFRMFAGFRPLWRWLKRGHIPKLAR
jgi:membrane-associated phospholipid phosphatase